LEEEKLRLPTIPIPVNMSLLKRGSIPGFSNLFKDKDNLSLILTQPFGYRNQKQTKKKVIK